MSALHNILATIERYFDGLYTGDIAELKTVFHPAALLCGDVNNEPYRKTLPEYLAVVGNRQSPRERGESRTMTVLAVDLLGNIASVRTHCRMLGFNYYDYLSLVQQDGRWQIVSKTFTHIEV